MINAFTRLNARRNVSYTLLILVFIVFSQAVSGQEEWKKVEAKPSTLGIEKGILTFNTPTFNLQLVKSSQTIAALQPNSEKGFDFTPGDRLKLRSRDGMYHLGDLNLRVRVAGDTAWKKYSTAEKRGDVKTLDIKQTGVLAAADLSGTLPARKERRCQDPGY